MDKIYSVNGPVVKVADTKSFAMQEMVYVGKKRLIGEVIRVQSDFTTIQVYEGTTACYLNRRTDVSHPRPRYNK